jgi:hypothetical protein
MSVIHKIPQTQNARSFRGHYYVQLAEYHIEYPMPSNGNYFFFTVWELLADVGVNIF